MTAKSFANVRKKQEHNTDSEIVPNPMNTSKVWAIESVLLEIYSLLAHRIKGLGWSLTDFWEADTWTTSKLYLMELALIEMEENELDDKKDKKAEFNNPEVEDVYEEMFPDDTD